MASHVIFFVNVPLHLEKIIVSLCRELCWWINIRGQNFVFSESEIVVRYCTLNTERESTLCGKERRKHMYSEPYCVSGTC